jgi:hypothetical protein
MADKNFLRHIEDLRSRYTPLHRDITESSLGEIKLSLQVIGDLDHRDWFNLIRQELEWIFMRSLDMLQADDYRKLFDDIITLHTNKNKGYAGVDATDAWANFRTAQWFQVTPFTGCLIRMGDKFIRVSHLCQNPDADAVNESIKDTLHDLAVYCIIAVCLLEEELVVSDVGKSTIAA